MLARPVQARVSVGCRRYYLGMNRNVCEEKATQLYLPQNVSGSRVWLVEPVVPGAPTITGAAVQGGAQAGVLAVTLNPPNFAGYYAISNYTVVCTPARGPSMTASGLGRNVGGQVRMGKTVRAGRPARHGPCVAEPSGMQTAYNESCQLRQHGIITSNFGLI